jgi:hypothetical protein
VPRSDSGRAATAVAQRRGGGLNDVPKLYSRLSIEYAPLRDKTFDWRFLRRPVVPPRRRRGTAVPRLRPPLFSRGGEQKCPISAPLSVA